MLCGLLALCFSSCHQGFQQLWAAGGHRRVSYQRSFGRRAVVWLGQTLLCSAKYVKCKSRRVY